MKAPIDAGYRLLAAGYYRKQARQLADQLDGVRTAEDIESIHRSRVASRRLRAAIGLLGEWVSAKQAKRWRKEIRRITAGLGDARDKDVQIDFLCRALTDVEDPACCLGIAHLIMHLEYQREVQQPTVVAAADRLGASGVLEEIRSEADRATAEVSAAEAEATPLVREHCGRQIRKRLKDLLSLQRSLEDAEDEEGHHRMRIAAKRLRYTLEICKPLYGDRVNEILVVVKNVQTLLGEIHDCDVWVAHLEGFLDEEKRRMAACFGSPRPFARVRVGLEYLQNNRRQARVTVFDEVVEYWQVLRGQGVWDELAAIARGESGAEKRKAASDANAAAPANGSAAGRGEGQPNGNGHRRLEVGHASRDVPTGQATSEPGRISRTVG